MRDARTTLADREAILTSRARAGNYFSPGQNASGASPRPTWTSSMTIAGIISTLAFMDSKERLRHNRIRGLSVYETADVARSHERA
jgi:hypothetical protein